jgi:hypothetical protein
MLKTCECLAAHEGAICSGYKRCGGGCGVTYNIQKLHKCYHVSCFRCHVMYKKDTRHLCSMQAPTTRGHKKKKTSAPPPPTPGAGADLGAGAAPPGDREPPYVVGRRYSYREAIRLEEEG